MAQFFFALQLIAVTKWLVTLRHLSELLHVVPGNKT